MRPNTTKTQKNQANKRRRNGADRREPFRPSRVFNYYIEPPGRAYDPERDHPACLCLVQRDMPRARPLSNIPLGEDEWQSFLKRGGGLGELGPFIADAVREKFRRGLMRAPSNSPVQQGPAEDEKASAKSDSVWDAARDVEECGCLVKTHFEGLVACISTWNRNGWPTEDEADRFAVGLVLMQEDLERRMKAIEEDLYRALKCRT